MTPDPFLGVGFHWLGGLAAASFYIPYRFVRHWSWETYWLVGGFFSWIVAPLVFGLVLTEDLFGVLAGAPWGALCWAWFFGLLWGLGGLTFGLTVRYLGMSLGYGVALGMCAVCGTLIPPLFNGQFHEILGSTSGRMTLVGIGVCVLGIGLSALAGLNRERELTAEAKKAAVAESNFRKGLAVALFCGVLSACFPFGLEAAAPVSDLSKDAGTGDLWIGLPKLVVVLWGGFTSNAVWCVTLNLRNRTGREYLAGLTEAGKSIPRVSNLVLCALAGVTWYFQFFFYTMGETQMARFGFSSWTLHMASIIIFSTFLGLLLKEWVGTSRFSRSLLAAGILVLIAATVIVGYGNYLGG